MQLKAGILLRSTSALEDVAFMDATILITEYNKNGAMGFVFNKIFERQLNELEEFKFSLAFPLYDGGPVDKEHLFFIHRVPQLIENGLAIGNGIYIGGNFKQAVQHINNKAISSLDIKIFIGYCGWDAKELEAEIAEGSWTIEEYNEEVFAL